MSAYSTSGHIDYQVLATALLQSVQKAVVPAGGERVENSEGGAGNGPGLDMVALAAAISQAASRVLAGAGADSTGVGGGGSGGAAVAEVGAGGVPVEGGGESGEKDAWSDVEKPAATFSCESGSVVSDTESSSGGSVTYVGAGPVVGREVRERVKFGGLGDNYESGETRPDPGTGYFSTVIRSANARALKKQVEALSGFKIPREATESLAICTYTLGVMPVVVKSGKDRLRTLAAVGDAAITLALTAHKWAAGHTVESAQAARSKHTSNAFLRDVMLKTGMVEKVSFPSGVDPATTVATATAFEAIVGVLALYRPSAAVTQFLQSVGVLE